MDLVTGARRATDEFDTGQVNRTGSAARRVLYLDMNVWVEMARGLKHADPGWRQLRDRLVEGTEDGTLAVPLSPAHYLELWHRRDAASREDIARVMRDVTHYATIPSPHLIRQREAQALVRTWAGAGADPLGNESPIVGRGAAHAFGRPTGRFRFVTSVASADGTRSEGPAAPAPDWAEFRNHPEFEWLQLAGHPELLAAEEGLDRAPEHRFGSGELQRELALRENLRRNPLTGARLHDLIVAQEFESIREYIEEVCIAERVPVPLSLRTNSWGADSKSAVKSLVEALPSANAWSTLRYHKHRDLNLPWEQHDWTDLWALSVAIPYCDVVVTEKRWTHLAKMGGLDQRFGTEIGSGRSLLERALARP